jgi:hypothetical protein
MEQDVLTSERWKPRDVEVEPRRCDTDYSRQRSDDSVMITKLKLGSAQFSYRCAS